MQDQPTRKATSEGKTLCKFDLFVRLKHTLPSTFPKKNRVHTFRGDQYDNLDTDDKMLIYLMNVVNKYWKKYSVMMIRDNDLKKGNPDYILFSLHEKDVRKNILKRRYPAVFENMEWPDWLITEKESSNDSDEDHPR